MIGRRIPDHPGRTGLRGRQLKKTRTIRVIVIDVVVVVAVVFADADIFETQLHKIDKFKKDIKKDIITDAAAVTQLLQKNGWLMLIFLNFGCLSLRKTFPEDITDAVTKLKQKL